MNSGKELPPKLEIGRSFEQSPNAVSFYCDVGQVIATGNEIVIQFYETIPGVPSADGKITKVVSRLRATVTLSVAHAQNIGKLLVERTKGAKDEAK
jgi:hypothetical protein